MRGVGKSTWARARFPDAHLVDPLDEFRFGSEIEFDILRNAGSAFTVSSDPRRSEVLPGGWTLTRARNRTGRFSYNLDHAS